MFVIYRMVGRASMALAVITIGLTLSVPALHADSFSQDAGLSRSLTDYLQVDSHFPLVSAQVLSNRMGDRKVILFGFVASTDEKITAELRATEFLSDPWIDIVDQLKIRPELSAAEQQQSALAPAGAANGNTPLASPADSTSQEMPNDIQAYEAQFQNEMLGPGFGSFAGAVPFLGVGTLVGLPLFYGIPIFGLAPLAVNGATTHPTANMGPSVTPAGKGLIGATSTSVSTPTSPGALGGQRPGFQRGPMFGPFRPVGGLGRR
jgi:hypothetical protein